MRLRGVSPPVWQRLLIPEPSTVAQLHHVMQLAIGWRRTPAPIRRWIYPPGRTQQSAGRLVKLEEFIG
jgi:hypothetical protein